MNFNKNGLLFRSYKGTDMDKEFIDELAKDLKVRQYLSNIKKYNKVKNTYYETPFIVTDEYTLEDIGYVYFHKPEYEEIDMIYAVCPDFRLNSYGKRIVDGATNFVLNKEKSLEKVCLIINPNNVASINTAISVGYKKIGNIRYEKTR